MNKYEVTVKVIIEALNQEIVEDIIRDVMDNDPDVVSYEVDGIEDVSTR